MIQQFNGGVHSRLSKSVMAFYQTGIDVLLKNEIPFLVGGAYALNAYTGVERHTKDLDIFIQQRHLDDALAALKSIGCRTEVTFPHWLAKAYADEAFIDLIYASGNGLAIVDDEWFTHARPGIVMGRTVFLCPPEEMIWSKAFITERERFDGADINHIIQSQGTLLDWNRLLRRFGPRWRVLLSHLIMFGFVYPAERHKVPPHVMEELIEKVHIETLDEPDQSNVCNGTLVSREQYLVDIHEWGYDDARLNSDVRMTPYDIDLWTNAIQRGRADHA
jgi:hypothetical protein